MDRLFLDANILFSAAYRHSAGLLALWKLKDVTLCTSRYALEEARINLSDETQRQRLVNLSSSLDLFDAPDEELPKGIRLPENDIPIILAATAAQATHLLTGDVHTLVLTSDERFVASWFFYRGITSNDAPQSRNRNHFVVTTTVASNANP